jgi:hypothetical protein
VRVDVGYVLNPRGVFTEEVRGASNELLVASTPVSNSCVKSSGSCIFEARWAFHITLGEAF